MQLARDGLEKVRTHIRQRLREGLTADGQVVSALPAYLSPPSRDLTGTSLVVDIGGTNVRAAVVDIAPGHNRIVRGPTEERLSIRNRSIDAQEFFRMQARLAARLEVPQGLPVGYCFSYPSEVLPDRDAVLLRWTKNIDVPGVVGERVGDALRGALDEAGLQPGPIAVLNDTVAALLATAIPTDHGAAPRSARDGIGLIVGTGTNMATYFDADEAPKLATLGTRGPMAFNLESGNVDPSLTEADDAVDAASPNPGHQRFEKAVSGYYLPFLFKAVHPTHSLDPNQGSAPLSELAESGPPGPEKDTARALFERSADLVAAALCAIFDSFTHDAGRVDILAEGSLFWRTPGYRARVEEMLSALAGPKQPFSIVRIKDANLYGAAFAALSD